MKLALILFAIAILATACGQTSAGPTQAQATASPEKVGTATLSATGCDVEMLNQLPLHEVTVSLANKTKYTGHFSFVKIHDNHTFKDLIDHWNSPLGPVEHPSFITEIRQADVLADASREVVVPFALKGSYALGCVYVDETNKPTGFFHELKAG
jgi:hypothetical protein